MANVPKWLLGYRNFYAEIEIINFIINSKHYIPETEKLSEAKALMIFQISEQQTWLIFTCESFYCILDDIRKEYPNINWSMNKKQIINGTDIILDIKIKDKTEKTGLVDIGLEHKNWLFTKSLFFDETIEDKIIRFVKITMLSHIFYTLSYVNKNGVEFQIEYKGRAPVPEDADYFAFRFLTTMIDGRVRYLHVYVRKYLISDIDKAEHFAKGPEPLREIKRLLDYVDKSGTTPIFWPDSSKGWTVY